MKVANVVSRLLEEDNQIQLSWELYMLSYSPKQEVFFVSLCHQECVDMPVTTNYTMIIVSQSLVNRQMNKARCYGIRWRKIMIHILRRIGLILTLFSKTT